MSTKWLIRNTIVIAGLAIAAAAASAACSSDPETSGSGRASQSSAGPGGGTTSQSSTTAQSSGSGQGGEGQGGAGGAGGGSACGDTLTDPQNCGACGNLCALGQTCEAGACACGVGAMAAFAEVEAIFAKSCGTAGNCHNKATPSGGLDLRPGMAYASLVGVNTKYCQDGRKRVEPGKPSESYIIDKVMGTQLCDTLNGPSKQMPINAVLPATDIETIAAWICAGANP